jgi:MFS family permease
MFMDAATRCPPALRWRLSVLQFLTFAPMGALLPFFTLRLAQLGFGPLEMAAASSTQALASLIAPLLAGQVADRWLSADRCLSTCAFLATGLLWLLSRLTAPVPLFWASLAFWLVMAPLVTLCNALCFIHLPRPASQFGPIRLWGTVGWVVAGWLVGAWFALSGAVEPDRGDAFVVGSLLALALAGYSLTLPHTPPRWRFNTRPALLDALQLLRRRSFAVYLVCTFGVCISIPFSTQNTPLLLEHLGIRKEWLGPAMTIAQSTEIVALLLLPMVMARWSVRAVMLAGALSWALALGVLAVGSPLALVVGSLGLHGFFICLFVVAGQVYVNGEAGDDIRASAQALIVFSNGLGLLGGHFLAGSVKKWTDESFPLTFGVAAGLAAVCLLVFAVGFRGERAAAGAA